MTIFTRTVQLVTPFLEVPMGIERPRRHFLQVQPGTGGMIA